MRKFLAITAVALTFAAATTVPTYASEMSEGASCGHAPKSQWMSNAAIKSKIASEGYKVRRLKPEGHCMEVYAIDKHGARAQLQVNPVSGDIVSTVDND